MISKINHTQISNQFIDEIMCTLSGSEVKVFLAICRNTIGWHKDTDYISISQLMKKTGLSNRQVINSTRSLEEKKYIISEKVERKYSKYSINYGEKTSSNEKSAGEKSSSAGEKTSSENVKTGEKSSHTKESIKETITKEKSDFFNKIWELYDKKEDKKKAIIAFNKIKKTEYSKIIEHIPKFIKYKHDKKFRPLFSTYLNGERWNDEIEIKIREIDRLYPDLLPIPDKNKNGRVDS